MGMHCGRETSLTKRNNRNSAMAIDAPHNLDNRRGNQDHLPHHLEAIRRLVEWVEG
jgi:ribosomal protein L32